MRWILCHIFRTGLCCILLVESRPPVLPTSFSPDLCDTGVVTPVFVLIVEGPNDASRLLPSAVSICLLPPLVVLVESPPAGVVEEALGGATAKTIFGVLITTAVVPTVAIICR